MMEGGILQRKAGGEGGREGGGGDPNHKFKGKGFLFNLYQIEMKFKLKRTLLVIRMIVLDTKLNVCALTTRIILTSLP